MEYKFDDEETLGKAVKKVMPFSKLHKSMDVPSFEYIVGDFALPKKFPGLAGKKWSRLCGFTFIANNGTTFQFVYVPKLSASFDRTDRALSGWYCWVLDANDKDNKRVTSIPQTLHELGFDINKFVHSDLFNKYLPKFKANVSYALSNQVQQLLDDVEASSGTSLEKYNELKHYVNAVKDSLQKIGDVQKYVTPDSEGEDGDDARKHAKIAYNANKTYDLRNNAKKSQQDMLKKRAIERLASKAASKSSAAKADAALPAKSKDSHIKFDPRLKYKFGGGRTSKADSQIFDKYDDYDNDDFR